MKKFKLISKMSLMVFALLMIVSCDDDDPVKTPETIAEIAIATPGLESLVTALDRAGLVNVLNSSGQYTVFAPTNAAFNTFLSTNNFASVSDVPVDVLTQVLLNHVIAEELSSSSLTTGYKNTLATYSDTDLNLSMFVNTTNGVKLNGVSNVTTANIEATNGVIHVVDAVIGIPTVVTFATADPNFTTLVSALTTLTPNTDFVSILSDTEEAFTVFAPTNDAFSALSSIPEESTLTQVLLHHVVSGNIQSGALTPNGNTVAPSLQGNNLTITLPGTGSNIANVTDGSGNSDIGIIAVNVQAGNGVIHVINKVAIPNLQS
ncbi:fasciclin domain-containing protein [Mariniflexile litorale]|uniref:Fasciclin domain-containing protein n=1 Tax=Mariniflexile litorale TaxID=3045158 RepID=A0AAU7EG06_9FLAO|nr:fasciclin domain-containing protein [Mariniflexile sp. KMM 9835]MDQ8211615.1 fasciclin domain-containing protein [Mariniflexile sp. KMM 9835]